MFPADALASNFFNFTQFPAKISQNNRVVAPPLRLVPPSGIPLIRHYEELKEKGIK